LLVGQPLTSGGSLFVARCASTATPASNSTRGWPAVSTHDAGKHRPCAQLQTGRPDDRTRTRTTARERDSCVVESSWTRLRRVFAFFCHAAFSLTSSQGRHRHRSVCEDTEAVVAATRRICAAFKRGARISIASVHAVAAQVKAINSSTVLLARRDRRRIEAKRQKGRVAAQ